MLKPLGQILKGSRKENNLDLMENSKRSLRVAQSEMKNYSGILPVLKQKPPKITSNHQIY